VFVDITPLRTSPDFRKLWIGQSISFIGTQSTLVAGAIQVFRLTHSSLAVGGLGAVRIVPLLVLSLYGGALADAVDRRKMMLAADFALMLCSASLAFNASRAHPSLPAIYVLVAIATSMSALGRPSLWAMMPKLVEKDQLMAASALNGIYINLGAVAGPALGGFLIATLGLTGTYVVDVGSFAASLVSLALIRPMPAAEGAQRAGVASIMEGIRYAKSRPVLMGTYLIDFNAMIFGMPSALFPAIAATRYGGSPSVVGLLYGAPYAGALVGSALSGLAARVHRHGIAITVSVLVWGASMVAFGLARPLVVALACLAAAGLADYISALYRSTIWNVTIPDALRGRLAGLELANVASGPPLGDFEAGVVASLTSVRVSIVSGGLACIVGAAVLAALLPDFRRNDSHHPHE
jgi:MFS family permease